MIHQPDDLYRLQEFDYARGSAIAWWLLMALAVLRLAIQFVASAVSRPLAGR